VPPRLRKAPPPAELGADGLPVLPYAPAQDDLGICPACLMAARVAVHQRGGFYTHCRHCGFRSFTSTPAGAVVFRAMQRLLRDVEMRKILRESLLLEIERVEQEMKTPPLPGTGSPG